MQFYLNAKQEQGPKDADTIYVDHSQPKNHYTYNDLQIGWYWQAARPGSKIIGPFATESAAIADAQGGAA